MSGQSIWKPIYDQHAVDFFTAKGWNSCIINKKRWYCDVLAIKENDIAIIEVKSPAEISTGPNYNDMGRLRPEVVSQFPSDFQNRRRSIMGNITSLKKISLVKLYAIGISCQLYRYFMEFEFKRHLYQSAISTFQLPSAGQCQLRAYFLVPIEAKEQCQEAITYLKTNEILNNTSEDENSILFCSYVIFT